MQEGPTSHRKDTFEEKVEKIRERILGPRSIEVDKNVKFSISISGNEASVELLKDDVDILHIREIIPKETKIKFNLREKWNVDFTDPEHPIINIGKMIGVQDVLLFMHEAMHAHNSVDSLLAIEADVRYREEIFKDKEGVLPESRVRALQYAREQTMHSERGAWADALRALRTLEHTHDISILKRFGTHTDVRDFINECLKKYEYNFVAQLYEFQIFNKEQMLKFFTELDLLYGEKEEKAEL